MKINDITNEGKTGPGLWANIDAKRKRGEKMRKKGAPGAPTEKALKAAQAGSKNESVAEGFIEEQGVAEDQLDELSSDFLKRAAQGAKDKRDQAMNPEIHDALGGGYMNPLAKHYDTKSDKFSNRAVKVGRREAVKKIASPAVMRKIGMAEGDNPEYDDEAGMADNNLETLKRAVDGIDELISTGDNLPEWCQEKIAVAKSMLVAVWDYMKSEESGESQQGLSEGMIEETYHGDEFYEAYGDLWYDEEQLNEAEYQGRKVQLGKPMRGDVKKFKVFVKDPSTGNVKKVNFGDPNMRIKKSNPARRKSFRARHNCDNPGPRTSARYWSCRKW